MVPDGQRQPKDECAQCSVCRDYVATDEAIVCTDCHRSEVNAAEDSSFSEGYTEAEREGPGWDAIRDWARRKKMMGEFDDKMVALFELCADDLEVGHG